MATGSKTAGVDVLVKINTGTAQAPVLTTVGGQSSATINRSMEVIETTDKTSGGWMTKIGGIKEWSVDCDAFMVTGDAGYKALSDAFKNRTALNLEIAVGTGVGSVKFTGSALISDFPIDLPGDDAVTFTLTFEGSGELVEEISAS